MMRRVGSHLFDLGGALGVREAAKGCTECSEDLGCLTNVVSIDAFGRGQREYLETVYLEVGHDGGGGTRYRRRAKVSFFF